MSLNGIENILKNFIAPPDFIVELTEGINPGQMGSEFYCGAGSVVSMSSGNRFAEIIAEGELRIYIGEDYFKNEMASKEFRSQEMTDADMKKFEEEDAFINSNWFNIYIGEKENKCVVSTESVCSTLDKAFQEAIAILKFDDSEWREEMEYR